MKIKVAQVATVDLTLRLLLLGQLRNLIESGYSVVGISSSGPDVPVVERAGIRHIPVKMTRRAFTPLSDLGALLNLVRVLRQEKPTIVHTYTPKAGLLGRLAARLTGVPIIIHTHLGFVFHDQSPWVWKQFFILLEKIAGSWSDLILSLNREDMQIAAREHIWDMSKVKLLGEGGNGVDVKRFDRHRISDEDLARIRNSVGLSKDVQVIGFAGRLVREKGLQELFAAMRFVREQIQNVRLLIVGPVDKVKPDAVTPEMAHEYGIRDICHFLGRRDDLPELYALMDIFVLPSHREGFGLVLAEAAAMGVPVIASDIRGCREALEPQRNGLLVPLGDVQALADAIIDLLTDTAKAKQMGIEGRQVALERFDERLVFARVQSEYTRLLREKHLIT